tara:strand:+ start:237 stop:575 length:339 start_codon:yes stop_codon:yes gene_type:complete
MRHIYEINDIKTSLEYLKEHIEETNIPKEHWENEIAELMEWYADYYYQQMNEMKETLKERLEKEISRIDSRCEQLRKNVLIYQEYNDFQNAMNSFIKLQQLEMVSQSFQKLL